MEVDGEHTAFRDDLLDKMVGRWDVGGSVMGQPVQQTCTVEWVLNHQFLRIHLVAPQESAQGADPPYEAMVFIGYDHMSERYVAHWMDTFGGRFSEVLGFGTRDSSVSIRLEFEGGSGPLHNTLSWSEKTSGWKMLIRQKDSHGKWMDFADQNFTPATKS